MISISVNEKDPSFVKLKEAKDIAARLKITGRDVYQMQRSFDVLESAANNEGMAGGLMGAGLGLGAGVAAGGQMSSIASQMNTNPSSTAVPPPLPNANVLYFVVVNGAQQGPYDLKTIISLIQSGGMVRGQLVWKAGMANWAKIEELPEFASYFMIPPPIPMP